MAPASTNSSVGPAGKGEEKGATTQQEVLLVRPSGCSDRVTASGAGEGFKAGSVVELSPVFEVRTNTAML